MSELTTLEICDSRWSNFVETSPDAGAFHRPEWAHLLAGCYGYRAIAVSRIDTNGHVSAGLPILEVKTPFAGRRWVSLPFTDYCAPLATNKDDIGVLVEQLEVERRARGISRLEVRAALPGANVHRRTTAVTHSLRLGPDPQAVFRTFKPAVQRAVQKAAREGVTVRTAESPTDLVDTFYQLHMKTRVRLGVPVQPRRYFRRLWQSVIDPGLGFILLASAGGVPIAAAVFLAWNGTIEYKYGASSPEFWKLRPNNLLFSTAIRWGCENGYRFFNFGRTDLEDEGLRTFKLGWGAVEEPLVYSTLGDVPADTSKTRLTVLLRLIIRRMPPWVCRLVGELAYKYAA